MRINKKKIISFITASLITMICIPNLITYHDVFAAERSSVTAIQYPFGSGYSKYPGSMSYNVTTYTDGSIYVYGSANKAYLPADLEGDYVKFCTIQYDSNDVEFVFYPEFLMTGSFYTEDSISGTIKTTEIWCKHAAWGIISGFVFEFNLIPKTDSINTSVYMFDTTFDMITTDSIPKPPSLDDIELPNPPSPDIITTTPVIKPTEPRIETTIPNPPSPALSTTVPNSANKTDDDFIKNNKIRPTIYPNNNYFYNNDSHKSTTTDTITSNSTKTEVVTDKKYNFFITSEQMTQYILAFGKTFFTRINFL